MRNNLKNYWRRQAACPQTNSSGWYNPTQAAADLTWGAYGTVRSIPYGNRGLRFDPAYLYQSNKIRTFFQLEKDSDLFFIYISMSEPDPMFSMLEWLCKQLMEAEVSGIVGAEKDAHNSSRSDYRCGYRPRWLGYPHGNDVPHGAKAAQP